MNKKSQKKQPDAPKGETIKLAKASNLDQIAEELLMPLIQWCGQAFGRTKRVLDIVNDGLTEKISHKSVYRWLDEDATNRRPPSAGGLIRLLDAWRKIRGEDVVNMPMPSLYCVVNGHEPKRDGLSCKRCECRL